jgi:prophage tail gpP-like protein
MSDAAPKGRMTLQVAGMLFTSWTRMECIRDLSDISGSFIFDYDDASRFAPFATSPDPAVMAQWIKPFAPCSVLLDGEPILVGYVDDVHIDVGPDGLRASVTGRDRTGDLVDCDANPEGPAEYKGLDLTGIVTRLVAPFGLTVRADVDVGPVFPKFSIGVSEPVMSCIEKAARERGILVVSDGIGGVVLTKGGQTRGPAPLVFGQNLHRWRTDIIGRGRFSDHWIKGQLPRVKGKQAAVALDSSVAPLGTGAPIPPTPGPAAGTAAPGRRGHGRGRHHPIYQTGHAVDAGVPRYRPKIYMTRAQAGLDTVDAQAEWRKRLSIARADSAIYTVVDYRGDPSPAGRLWRPNELVAVTDPIRGLEGIDMLIGGCTYLDGEDGPRTALRVVRPGSYDLDEEVTSPRKAGRSAARHQHAVDATSRRLR